MTNDGFEAFGTVWVNSDEALRISKRSARTLDRWRQQRQVRTRVRRGRTEFAAGDLRLARRKNRAAYKDRTFVPGPGRGHRHPETERISSALDQGMAAKDIAEMVGCSDRTVSRIRREHEDKNAVSPA